jgi:hypothetical protein
LPFDDRNPLSDPPDEDALPSDAAPQLALKAMTVWMARLKHWTGVDRAIAYTVMGRSWMSLAGVVTVLLIARFLTPTEQGYYYTFSSLVMLQIVFELGFSFVILQLAAHERVDLIFLPDGQVEGNLVSHSRLASLLQKAIRWYSVAGLLMALAVLPAGFYFFRAQPTAGAAVAWRLPWCLLVIATMLNFQIDPVFSFLEGCGFVTQVAQRRLVQVLLGSLLGWAALVARHGLYAPAMVISGQVAGGLAFLFFSKLRLFLKNLMSYPVGEHYVGWRREIWPFQWKIAVSWICSYFILGLFNPILFAYQGPVAAGQMGMSVSIASALGAVAIAWMYTKTSPFGSMVARGEIAALDALFFRTLRQSTVLLGTGAIAFFLALLLAERSYPKFAARVLPPWAFALLLLTTIMNHVIASESLYLRSHKREPFLWQSVTVAVLLGSTTLILGKYWGVTAVTAGYFVVGGLISLVSGTYIFTTKRQEWHGERA